MAAHEIGHSLSLNHTDPTVAHSIMNPSSLISPLETYSFVQADLDRLATALPGPGRGGVPAMVAAQTLTAWDDEGVEGDTVVVCRRCQLRVRAAQEAAAAK